MSYLGASVLTVERENRSHELRNTEGKPITQREAKKLMLSKYQVPMDIRRELRRRKCKKGRTLKLEQRNGE